MNLNFTTLEISGLVLAVEFALLAWIVPVMILRRRNTAAAADGEAVDEMLETVEEKTPSRREALSTIFASTYQLKGDELENTVNEFIEREQSFYQVMTSVYLEREPERLAEIPDELMKVISPWIRMTPRDVVPAAEADALASANSELSSELEQTKASMDALMVEYMAAFEKARSLEAASDADQAAPEAEPAAAAAEAVDEDEVAAEPVAAATADGGDVSAEATDDTAETPAAEPTAPVAIDLSEDDPDDQPEQAVADAPAFDVSADADDDGFSQDDIDALFADDEEESAAA